MTDMLSDMQTWRRMFQISSNIRATEHNEDPDSPRSSPAPTSAALHSKQWAQSPGYHSNSDYRPPVVNHHITNTYTQMVSRGGCTVHMHENTVLTNMSTVIHILARMCVRARARAQWEIDVLAIATILSLFSLDVYLPNAFLFSVGAALPPLLFRLVSRREKKRKKSYRDLMGKLREKLC